MRLIYFAVLLISIALSPFAQADALLDKKMEEAKKTTERVIAQFLVRQGAGISIKKLNEMEAALLVIVNKARADEAQPDHKAIQNQTDEILLSASRSELAALNIQLFVKHVRFVRKLQYLRAVLKSEDHIQYPLADGFWKNPKTPNWEIAESYLKNSSDEDLRQSAVLCIANRQEIRAEIASLERELQSAMDGPLSTSVSHRKQYQDQLVRQNGLIAYKVELTAYDKYLPIAKRALQKVPPFGFRFGFGPLFWRCNEFDSPKDDCDRCGWHSWKFGSWD